MHQLMQRPGSPHFEKKIKMPRPEIFHIPCVEQQTQYYVAISLGKTLLDFGHIP
jgi:hypothetical protein